jgi:hypothetical protein
MDNSYYAQFHTSAELETVFGQVFGGRLAFCGFEAIGPRKWVKETGQGFKYYFFLNALHNGFSYLPCGAVSIDFVPRLIAGRLKIQPKLKNVAVHLSFGDRDGVRWGWDIDKNRAEFREKCERIAGESVTEITAWFQRFNSLDDVVGEFDRIRAKSGQSDFYRYPISALAYAFVLARVSRIESARAEFAEVMKSSFWDDDAREEMQTLFDAEIKRSKHS